MESNLKKLTKKELISLRTRWHAKDVGEDKTLLETMIQRLKTECVKHHSKRPLKLDLRGISLANMELSNLDFSGYDFSYANLNQSNLTNCVCSYSTFHETSMEQAMLDEW